MWILSDHMRYDIVFDIRVDIGPPNLLKVLGGSMG
jgi:hypothetical protein